MTNFFYYLKRPSLVFMRSRTYFTVENRCNFDVQIWVSGDPNARVIVEGSGHFNIRASATGSCLGGGAHFGKQFLPKPRMVQKKLLISCGKSDQVLTQSNMVYVTVFNE